MSYRHRGRKYHLKQLFNAGILQCDKRGSFAYLSLEEGALDRICMLLGYAAPATA
jgi:hypothetical protein